MLWCSMICWIKVVNVYSIIPYKPLAEDFTALMDNSNYRARQMAEHEWCTGCILDNILLPFVITLPIVSNKRFGFQELTIIIRGQQKHPMPDKTGYFKNTCKMFNFTVTNKLTIAFIAQRNTVGLKHLIYNQEWRSPKPKDKYQLQTIKLTQV
jgi:hypothetical protein